MSRPFWSETAWAGLGLAVSGGCQWAVIAALARMTDPTVLGSYGLAVAVATPLIVFSHFGQRALMVNGADGGASLRNHVLIRLGTGSLALFATIAVGLIMSPDPALTTMLVWVGVSRLADSILDATLGAFQRKQRLDLTGKAQVVQGAVSLSAFAIGLWWTRSAPTAVMVWAIVRLVLVLEIAKRGTRFERDQLPAVHRSWKELLRLGLPLACSASLALLAASLPRLLVGELAGRRSLGLFAAMASLETVGSLAIAGAAQTAAPRLARQYLTGDERGFRRLLWRLAGLAAAVGLAGTGIGALAGSWTLGFLFGPVYAEESGAFVVLLAAAGAGYLNIVMMSALTARQILKPQPWVHVAAIVAGLASGPMLVGRHQIVGAAWTSMVVACSQLACLLMLLRLLPAIPKGASA